MNEIEFQRKPRKPMKIYVLLAIVIFLILISLGFSYFMKQVNSDLDNNANLNFLNNVNNQQETSWQTIVHDQIGYQIDIPTSWYSRESGSDLLISSYDLTQSIKPTKKANFEIQLVANPLDLSMEDWWQALYQEGEDSDYVQGSKNILIDNQPAVKKTIVEPDASPLDVNYTVLVKHEGNMYVFNMLTEGYTAKQYEDVFETMLASFHFPKQEVASNLNNTNSETNEEAVQVPANLGWQIYQNTEKGFQIEFPDSWHIYSEGEVPMVSDVWQIIFEDQKYAGQQIERPYIAVSVIENQNSLSEWFDIQKESLAGSNLLYNDSYTLNDLEGVMYTSGGLGVGYNFATLYNNRIYRIWSLTFFPADDTLMNFFKMLDSFKLITE